LPIIKTKNLPMAWQPAGFLGWNSERVIPARISQAIITNGLMVSRYRSGAQEM